MNIHSLAILYTIEACQKNGIPYSFPNNSGEILCVTKNNKPYFYIHQTVPINSQAQCKLAEDKLFCVNVLNSNFLKTPQTEGFIDPNIEKKYQSFKNIASIDDICNNIITHFSFPVIIKKNSGSQGINVFLCTNRKDVLKAISTIFDKNSQHYDYLALAQEYIQPLAEFRVIYLHGNVQFAYKKDISKALFTGNLSPLHWQGSQAVLVSDTILLKQFQDISLAIFQATGIEFCGVDIIQDVNKNLWIIELNGKPGFSEFLKNNSDMCVKQLYTDILLELS